MEAEDGMMPGACLECGSPDGSHYENCGAFSAVTGTAEPDTSPFGPASPLGDWRAMFAELERSEQPERPGN